MSEPARRVATYEDVLAAPEGMTAEILGGELVLSPRPSVVHQRVAWRVGRRLGDRFDDGIDGPGGWILIPEVELHLGRPDPRSEVVVPDLSGWRRERLPEIPDTPGMTLAPDWVCEILSPGSANARRDRLIKPDIYHRAGIPWVWLVEPRIRTIEVFKHAEEGYLRVGAFGGRTHAAMPPFDAVSFDLAAWWPPSEEDAEEPDPEVG